MVSAAVKPDGVSAEVVRAALDEVLRFAVCPRLVDELRRVLARDRFREYLSQVEADVLVDAIEAVSDVVSDPEEVPRVSPDPDDDYLIALARREDVDGIISGDPDLVVEGGPPVVAPGDVLRRLQLGPSERRLLVTALWNLHLRISEATAETDEPELTMFLDVVHAAARKLGGDPDAPLFGVPDLAERRLEVRDLSRGERTACGHALAWDRRATGALHAEHEGEAERLSLVFAIIDHYAAVERVISS